MEQINRKNLIKILTLEILNKKGTMDTSYTLHQIYTKFEIFESTHEILDELNSLGLITTTGYFDVQSKIFKNITLSNAGKDYLMNHPVGSYKDNFLATFNNDPILIALLNNQIKNR